MHELCQRLSWLTTAGACIIASAAASQELQTSPPTRHVVLCQGCGIVYDVRRIERPIAPEHKLLPDIGSTPREGVSGQTTQAVPLFAFGGGTGARRVTPEPIYRTTWEVTIRYDNGSFGFITTEAEPGVLAGDRVRMVEGIIEPLTSNRRTDNDSR